MTQRKQTIKKEIKFKPIKKQADSDLPITKSIRCIWNGRLIIPADQTPSGKRYAFESGQVQPVNAQDYDFLLSKEKKQKGCCGSGGSTIKYFEEV